MTQEENLKSIAEISNSNEPITEAKTTNDIDTAKDGHSIEQSEGENVGFEGEATVDNVTPEDVDLHNVALAIMGVRR